MKQADNLETHGNRKSTELSKKQDGENAPFHAPAMPRALRQSFGRSQLPADKSDGNPLSSYRVTAEIGGVVDERHNQEGKTLEFRAGPRGASPILSRLAEAKSYVRVCTRQ